MRIFTEKGDAGVDTERRTIGGEAEEAEAGRKHGAMEGAKNSSGCARSPMGVPAGEEAERRAGGGEAGPK